MQARVTAVLVAHNGAERLPRTLAAVEAQTRRPDALVVVDAASTDTTAKLLSEVQPTGFLSASSRLTFGVAISHALGVVSPPSSDSEWLWLLAHDSAPEPGALAALLAAVEVNPSVAVAGPKQMEWNNGDYIAGFGESITRFGSSVPLVERELDQAQHDRMSDVLGVGAAGMLVRHTVWNQLGGFDDALHTADNGLDFSIRARLAGHRVMAVPDAKVATAGDGLSGPGTSAKGSQRRKRQSARRAAQLHRRLVYAPAFAVVFHWLSLVPLAVVRTFFQVLRKQPGAVTGEFAAAFRTAFSGRVGAARRSIRTTRSASWGAVAPLRVPGGEVRRRNALVRELALSRARGSREELFFFSGGGAAIVIAAAVLGLALFFPLLGSAALTGGSFLPLGDVGGLWAQVGYGWRDLGLGFVGASDPFAYMVAVFGSITFWSPSVALVVLYLAAFPLAALAAWFCAAKLTSRQGLRVFAAVLWVIAPPFLSSMDAGQVGAIIAHLLLPWLVLAALSAARSWPASAIASLLFAGVLAAAPSLWPALLVLWFGAVVFSRRAIARYIGIPIPALALFLPLAYDQFQRGTPLGLLADPGLPNAHGPVSLIDLLLGQPQSGLGGWSGIGAAVGLDSATVQLIAVLLVVPLALIALVALFLPRSYAAALAALVAVLGFATAVAATMISVSSTGALEISIWPGAGLSLFWLGLLGAATIGLSSFTRLAALPAVVAAVAIAVLAVPVATSTLVGTSAMRPGTGQSLPAFVTAEATSNPRVGTLVLVPQSNGGLAASVVHGAGATLETQSTLAATVVGLSPAEQNLANLVGNLASRSSTDPTAELAQLGIEFVVLAPPAATASSTDAQAVAARATSSFDSNASLTSIGQTFAGKLWQVTGSPGLSALPAPSPSNTGTPTGVLILIIQAVVFGLALLLALPAGRLEAHGLRAATALDEAAELEELAEPDESGALAAGAEPDPDGAETDPDGAEPDPDSAETDPVDAEPDPEGRSAAEGVSTGPSARPSADTSADTSADASAETSAEPTEEAHRGE
ncbi:glycosyltransferase [Subtercola sp. PAMC28395]|uniref:glycosyltransferase n=1 Tax=Subtercola sp. PAMC28395 TaxID=2846775 RepID=UPI001C0CE78F|nr:glycosyltransferase [Subtercola sp. PAMC28395]QWT25048.1 glycosyltransferase [Subtercola sp. PAMC28395]